MDNEHGAGVDALIRAYVHRAIPDAHFPVEIDRIRHPILVRPRIHAWRIGAQPVVAKYAVGAVTRAGIHKTRVVGDVLRAARDIRGAVVTEITKAGGAIYVASVRREVVVDDAVRHCAVVTVDAPAILSSIAVADNRTAVSYTTLT